MTYEQAMELLQAMHDSEINGGIEWTFDRHWEWWLHNGTPNPLTLEYGSENSLLDAITSMFNAAAKKYSASDFAAKYSEVCNAV